MPRKSKKQAVQEETIPVLQLPERYNLNNLSENQMYFIAAGLQRLFIESRKLFKENGWKGAKERADQTKILYKEIIKALPPQYVHGDHWESDLDPEDDINA